MNYKVFEKIIAYLEEHQVSYEIKEHAPTYTSEDSARERKDALHEGAKAILYKVENQFYLLVLPAHLRVNAKAIKSHFKTVLPKVKKTRFASKEELLELTGLPPGAVPPFGEPIFPLPLYVDPLLKENELISFNAGSLTKSLRIRVEDYLKVAGAKILAFAQ